MWVSQPHRLRWALLSLLWFVVVFLAWLDFISWFTRGRANAKHGGVISGDLCHLKLLFWPYFYTFGVCFVGFELRFFILEVLVEFGLIVMKFDPFWGILSVVDVSPELLFCTRWRFYGSVEGSVKFWCIWVKFQGFMQAFRPELAEFRPELFRDSAAGIRGPFRPEHQQFRPEFIHSARNEDHSGRNEAVHNSGFSRGFSGCHSEWIPVGIYQFRPERPKFRPELSSEEFSKTSREFSGCHSESIPTGTREIPVGMCSIPSGICSAGSSFPF